ncbi:CapA family protein [Prevotella sp. E9-3]|uniref:CapA family protein n=1 Tax=Prevotella sp. E9-3 TaxID=2913621 RepID=UPI001ED9F553|nr:CapA family protein [Prevotella sp. E9-3]UKK49483.1 CapA family protein [Prevotella sp. E9-3]
MNKQIRIFFAGDFCSKPSTSRITVSDELKCLIQSCDLKVVNFEVPLKPSGALPPQVRERFFQNDDAPNFLRSIGFNLFQLANNHAFDWGEEGFKKTKSALGNQSFGAGTYDEAYKIKVCETNGLKIGFLSLSFAAYTGVFDNVRNHEGLGCAYINDLKVNHVIIEAKKEADYLFVLPHDGIEYIDVPLPETIARYRDFIDYGADGVIGTHPHCPQGWEIYKNKPIFYSLGNFLFNSKENYEFRANCPHWYEGLCVLMTIEKNSIKWEVLNTRNVDNVRLIIDSDKERIEHNRQLCRYLADKDAYDNYLNKICKTLGQKELSIVDRVFHPQTIKECTKLLFNNWKSRLVGKDFTNDNRLLRLLTHDARRALLMQTLKRNSNK